VTQKYAKMDESRFGLTFYEEPKQPPPSYTAAEAADQIVLKFVRDCLPEGEPTIMIVEDEELVRDLLVEMMQERGFKTIAASDAETAVLSITDMSQRIDLLLSDVRLPGMDGRELAQAARGYRPDLKVLFLTGYAPNATLRDEFLGDNMDLMTKPFRVDEVVEHVEAML